ncbi:formimidoylglutamase [Spelaeicoccus albus]|uniref:Formimidoylglutamase n=1 Tax=Spelaeicoccus albus TaxID=1280376 RepID=A0A7Z0D1X7_9MICO|nr:formimidoylglutamase [Spelaeicoccus albus]NYI67105.1 formiminoglutamase [Spelaeicoccus albus]
MTFSKGALVRDFEWTGRIDGPAAEHKRWHAAVQPGTARTADIQLLGFCSDEGVKRNGGRPGAEAGPSAIRTALASLALHHDVTVADRGDVTVDGSDLEAAQERLGVEVGDILTTGSLPLVMGGGHETAFGDYLGLTSRPRRHDRRLGILNLDAHFDLREQAVASSGTPFRQIADAEHQAGRIFRYAVVGISRPNNTSALFSTADSLGVPHLVDEDCQLGDLPAVLRFVDEFLDSVDDLYLTIDLDVLPSYAAPGVSAPATLGVPLPVVQAICTHVARSPKLALADVVELNPRFDVDARTARTAARLLYQIGTTATRRIEEPS